MIVSLILSCIQLTFAQTTTNIQWFTNSVDTSSLFVRTTRDMISIKTIKEGSLVSQSVFIPSHTNIALFVHAQSLKDGQPVPFSSDYDPSKYIHYINPECLYANDYAKLIQKNLKRYTIEGSSLISDTTNQLVGCGTCEACKSGHWLSSIYNTPIAILLQGRQNQLIRERLRRDK